MSVVLNRLAPRALGVTAGLAAVVLAVAGPASALTTVSSGHVDLVEVHWDNGEVEEVGTAYTPWGGTETDIDAADYVFNVDLDHKDGSVWVVPGDEPDAAPPNDLLWAGFAVHNEDTAPVGETFEVRLESATVEDGGTVTAVFDGDSFVATNPAGVTPTQITSADPVVLDETVDDHVHPQWTFTAAGEYELTFQVYDEDDDEVGDPITITFAVTNS